MNFEFSQKKGFSFPFFWKDFLLISFLVAGIFFIYLGNLKTKTTTPSGSKVVSSLNRFSTNIKTQPKLSSLVPLKITQDPVTKKTLELLLRFKLSCIESLKKNFSDPITSEALIAILQEPRLKNFYSVALEVLALKEIPAFYFPDLEKIVSPYLYSTTEEKLLLPAISVASFLPSKTAQLITYCKKEYPIKTRIHALKAVSRSAPSILLPILLDSVSPTIPQEKDEQQWVQASIYSLQFYSNKSATKALVKTLSHPSDILAREAINSLVKQSPQNLFSVLSEKLEETDFRLQRNIFKVISQSANEEFIPFLEKGIINPNESIQYLSAVGMSRIKSKKILPLFCSQLLSPMLHRKYKQMMIQEISSEIFAQKNIPNNLTLEPIALELYEKIQDPTLKLAYAIKLLEKGTVPLMSIVELLEPSEFPEISHLSETELNLCKLQAWQILIQKTNKYLPLEKEAWSQFLAE